MKGKKMTRANIFSGKTIYRAILASLLCILHAACEKPEPQYQLKEPFGNNTLSSVDEFESQPESIRIPKKNFDRAKWEETERKNLAIKKILKQAREWDPNSKGKRRRSL